MVGVMILGVLRGGQLVLIYVLAPIHDVVFEFKVEFPLQLETFCVTHSTTWNAHNQDP